MEKTEPSSATSTSRITLPERWAAMASGGYPGSVRLRRRVAASSGSSLTLWVGAILVPVILVVDDASTMESLSYFVELGLVESGFMRKMILPFS